MDAGRTLVRFLFGSDRDRFSDGFVVALMVGTTAALAALVAATMAARNVAGPVSIELLVTAVAGVGALGGLLYGVLGAGLLSGGTVAVSPYLGRLALEFVSDTFPYPLVTPADDLRLFAVVGVGLAVIGAGFRELPRALDDGEDGVSDTSDTSDE